MFVMGKKDKTLKKGNQVSTFGATWAYLEKAFPAVSQRPSIRGQQMNRVMITLAPVKFTSSGAGLIAANYSPTLSNTPNIASYQATYDEYRICGVRFIVVGVNNTTGAVLSYIDDEDLGAPTLASATQKFERFHPISNANSKSSYSILWRNQNVGEQDWKSTSTASTAAYVSWKAYADVATLGTTAAATDCFSVVVQLYVEFRGVGGK